MHTFEVSKQNRRIHEAYAVDDRGFIVHANHQKRLPTSNDCEKKREIRLFLKRSHTPAGRPLSLQRWYGETGTRRFTHRHRGTPKPSCIYLSFEFLTRCDKFIFFEIKRQRTELASPKKVWHKLTKHSSQLTFIAVRICNAMFENTHFTRTRLERRKRAINSADYKKAHILRIRGDSNREQERKHKRRFFKSLKTRWEDAIARVTWNTLWERVCSNIEQRKFRMSVLMARSLPLHLFLWKTEMKINRKGGRKKHLHVFNSNGSSSGGTKWSIRCGPKFREFYVHSFSTRFSGILSRSAVIWHSTFCTNCSWIRMLESWTTIFISFYFSAFNFYGRQTRVVH